MPSAKTRAVRFTQKYLLNPPVRALFALGLVPPTHVLLETTGRKSGRPRQNPVGNGLDGDTLWIVAEHGHRANYVRNLEADPHVRVKIGRTGAPAPPPFSRTTTRGPGSDGSAAR